MDLKNIFYYLTLMILSAEIMILEIVGAKALAPYFGSSHFVWISQIMITLLSLSIGAYAAYRFEHKLEGKGEEDAYRMLLLPAAYVGFSTLFFHKVAAALMGFSLLTASLLASVVLYFIPLSAISFSYSLLVSSKIKEAGSALYGKLSAIGTFGSVTGTFIFGYYLVKNFSNQTILIFSSFLLWLLFSLNSLFLKKKSNNIVLFPVLFIVFSIFIHASSDRESKNNLYPRVVDIRNTPFGELKVVEEKDKINVLNNNILQGSFYKKDHKSAHIFSYALSSLLIKNTKKLDSVFLMGLGLGLIPPELRANGVKNVTSVEINEDFVGLAKKIGTMKEDKVIINDGRYALAKSTEKYDSIVVDAFLVDNSPSHLNTKEFYQLISSRLNDGGTVVINSFGFFYPDSITTISIFKTIREVFKEVKAYSINNANVFFVASNGDLDEDKNNYRVDAVPINIQNELAELFLSERREFNLESGVILTDSFNPIDSLDIAAREKIRKLSLADQLD